MNMSEKPKQPNFDTSEVFKRYSKIRSSIKSGGVPEDEKKDLQELLIVVCDTWNSAGNMYGEDHEITLSWLAVKTQMQADIDALCHFQAS